MRIGIDLLWVKPGKNGGTESLIRNLLDGLVQYGTEHEYVLYVSRDNEESFGMYRQNANMQFRLCNVISEAPMKRYLWENLHLDNMIKKDHLDVMYIPVYSKPFTYGSKVPYVTNIADLQAFHYPQYFSKVMYWFMRFIWWYACKTSNEVITISDNVRDDLIAHYPFVKSRIQTTYLPIISKESGLEPSFVEEKYHVKAKEYFYCVSSILPHKNLETMLKVIAKLKSQNKPCKLILSGVGGHDEEFQEMCRKLDISDVVINSGFVTNEERDCLYENCRMFLFPSIFEGFGMPPIEVMRKGRNVVMTKKTCLLEVTEGKAIYVEDPYDVDEWIRQIEYADQTIPEVHPFEKYDLKQITEKYLSVLVETAQKSKKR